MIRNFTPFPSLALGYLSSFLRVYAPDDYNVSLYDVNMEVYKNKKHFDVNLFPDIMESVVKDAAL
tara:strand:- start:376 stop:570 length:195 start_codon:yes stop_codon:yes gene_type:complete